MRILFRISLIVVLACASQVYLQAAKVQRGDPITFSAPSTNVTAVTNSITTNTTPSDVIGFDKLAGYPMEIPLEMQLITNKAAATTADAKINAMIPANIVALDGQRISVEGFMVPLQYANGKVVEFMLSRDQATCCFGAIPRVHEWIDVYAKPPGVDWIADVPSRVQGVMHVGVRRDEGILSRIYEMDAETIGEAPAK